MIEIKVDKQIGGSYLYRDYNVQENGCFRIYRTELDPVLSDFKSPELLRMNVIIYPLDSTYVDNVDYHDDKNLDSIEWGRCELFEIWNLKDSLYRMRKFSRGYFSYHGEEVP
jgi:hypothetical protein